MWLPWWRTGGRVHLQGRSFNPHLGREAAKAVGPNYRAGSREPQELSPRILQPRSRAREGTATTEQRACSAMRTHTNKAKETQQDGDDWFQISEGLQRAQTAPWEGGQPTATTIVADALNYRLLWEIFVPNYKYIFAIFIRPLDHSGQTEILDRNTGTLQEISGNFFLSKQVSMGSACSSSVQETPTYIFPFRWLQRANRLKR